MRYLRLALLPLVFAACSDSQPAAPDLEPTPVLDVSAEHRALFVRNEGETGLFNAQGDMVPMYCGVSFDVVTQSATDMLTLRAQCRTPNPSRTAASFTSANNPTGPDVCAKGLDPDGKLYLLRDWREVVSATGNVTFIALVIPVYP